MISEQTIDEAEQKDELLFALHHRDTPTVVFLECNSYAKRKELADFLRQNLTEYQFKDVDVTRFSVVSLLRALTENLPKEVTQSTPVQYVANVYGLENSLLLSEDGQIKPSLLTAQLNLERELLFRSVPYIIIIWADHLFFQTLQRESPDFWNWVVYRFRFEGPEAIDPENASPLPPKRLPQQGDITERKRRIEELETTYNQLNLNTNDKRRLLKDKVTILTLLAEEYTEAFRYNEAQATYKNAIAIAGRMHEDDSIVGRLYYGLACMQLDNRQFSEATNNLERSLSHATEINYSSIYYVLGRLHQEQRHWIQALDNYQLAAEWKIRIGITYDLSNVYHQIGMVYAEQKQWTQALINYQLALNWDKKISNSHEVGKTYHQIGMVYAAQEQWMQAFSNYQLALEWKKRTENTYDLGSTYRLIGQLYETHRQWPQALTNYQLALKWNQEVGNTRQVGNVYHEIGAVYAAQQQWKQALTNYQSALEWNQKTSNEHELGSTYYHIGAAHEVQDDLGEAVRWYRLAIDNMTIHGREDQLPIAQGSLVRVESQLAPQ